MNSGDRCGDTDYSDTLAGTPYVLTVDFAPTSPHFPALLTFFRNGSPSG